MSKSRIRRSVRPSFPFGKSVVVSSGLIVAFMLFLAVLADPRSGEIKSPALAYSALGVTVLAIVAAFYTEFRFHRKYPRTAFGGQIEKPKSGTGRTMKRSITGERRKIVFSIAGLFAFAAAVPTDLAGQNASGSAEEKAKHISAGEKEAKKLLLLMDTDQNGKVSKQEFMNFMEAEFDRLDKDKNGELDVRELTQSRVRSSGVHR